MATLLPPAKRQFFDALGNPLASGTVAYFIPSTSTPKNTWQDAGQTTLNTNPITLDAAGEALIYGSGTYRELVKDSLGNTIWDQVTDQPSSAIDTQNGAALWGGTSTGAPNVYAITLNPVPGAYVAGQAFRFFSHQANTGAAVINANGLGNKNFTKNGSTTLLSGDIPANAVIEGVVDPNLNFELQTPPGTLQVTPGTGLQSSATVWSVDPSFFRGYLGGLTLSNDGVTPATILDIAAGVCVSDDATTLMKLASAFTKTTATWAVGTGNGALDTSTVANATWYHVYVIQRPDTGVVDVLFSTSATAPTMPSSYTKKRRIGSFKTDGSAAILAFFQLGDYFYWKTIIQDQNTTLAATAANFVVSAPLGVQTLWLGHGFSSGNTDNKAGLRLYNPSQADQAIDPSSDAYSSFGTTAVGSTSTRSGGNVMGVLTNTSSQIRAVAISTGTTFVLATEGWLDYRGRFA